MHLVVTPLPDGVFRATWTQASEPHGLDQRVVVARSGDRGPTWSPPEVIDAPEPGNENIASWSMLVPRSRRQGLLPLPREHRRRRLRRAMTGVLMGRPEPPPEPGGGE